MYFSLVKSISLEFKIRKLKRGERKMDKLIGEIYVYCTDFILNLANILIYLIMR